MMRLGLNLSLNMGYLIILASLIVLMAAGTVYGLWAEGRAQTPEAVQRLAIVNSRTRVGWWLIVTYAVAWWFGPATLNILFAIFSFFLLREFIALTPIKPTDHWVLVIAFYLAIPIQYVLVYFDLQAVYTVFIPVYLFLVLPVVAALSHDTDRYLERVAKVQWGVMICVFCVSHAPALANLYPEATNSTGLLVLLFFLITVFCTDLFAVIASSALGGKAIPMSPNKTVKGYLVGGIFGVAVGTALFWITPFAVWQATLFSIAIALACIVGDIVINSVKVSLGARNYDAELYIGRGILERLAPLTFAAPVFYHLNVVCATFIFK